MSRLLSGVIVWGVAFFVLELPAHFVKWWPYPTLSSTVWDAIKWWHPVAAWTGIFLFLLWLHFDKHWPAVWLLGWSGLLVAAVLIHVFA